MNRTFIIITTAVLLALIGLVFLRIFSSEITPRTQESNQVSQGGTVSVTGEVLNVDLSGMAFDGPALVTIDATNGDQYTIAVPSMGIRLCEAFESISDIGTISSGDEVQVLGTVDEEGRIVPCTDEKHYLKVIGHVSDVVHGFDFAYRKGPDGYVMLEDNESTSPDYVTGTVFFNKQEYDAFLAATDVREGPAAMHVRVYRNPQKHHAPVWATLHPQETNIELVFGEPDEAVVAGANATHFVADGLYPIDTYVVASGEYIYVLMGAYPDTESAIYKDFQSLVQSFTFIPTSSAAVQGKIDVRTVCEQALAYMTFESGEESDQFIESCVAGEHPDVIDRYLKELGTDDGAVI